MLPHISLTSVVFPPCVLSKYREIFELKSTSFSFQHLIEKEKLVLSVEQEILRVHGRAARALANQALPFSVCTFLKDEEVGIYGKLTALGF